MPSQLLDRVKMGPTGYRNSPKQRPGRQVAECAPSRLRRPLNAECRRLIANRIIQPTQWQHAAHSLGPPSGPRGMNVDHGSREAQRRTAAPARVAAAHILKTTTAAL